MRSESGLTIVELMIVLVIAGVMLAMAAPNMSVFVQNNRRAACLNTMVGAISYARSQAVSRNRRVTLCETDVRNLAAGALPTACTTSSPLGQFEKGFMVFEDTGGVQAVVDAGETILRVFQPTDCDVGTLRGFRSDDNNPVDYLSYGNTGLPTPKSTDSFNGIYVEFCDARGDAAARSAVISVTGQPRNSRDGNGDGTHERPDASAPGCPHPPTT